MKIETIMGLTLSQIAWMKMYFAEEHIEIPKNPDIYKFELREELDGR